MAALYDELQSFLAKFTQLCNDGIPSSLNCNNYYGDIIINFNANLGSVNRPNNQQYASSKKHVKPSQFRRRKKREKARCDDSLSTQSVAKEDLSSLIQPQEIISPTVEETIGIDQNGEKTIEIVDNLLDAQIALKTKNFDDTPADSDNFLPEPLQPTIVTHDECSSNAVEGELYYNGCPDGTSPQYWEQFHSMLSSLVSSMEKSSKSVKGTKSLYEPPAMRSSHHPYGRC